MKYHQPFDQPNVPNAPYVDGNPGAGIAGSIPPAAQMEYPQREIVSAIALSGQTPDDGDLNQLTRAIRGGQLDFASDTGTGDALVATLSLAHNQIKAGLPFVILKGAAANATTTPKLTLQGPGGANPLTQNIVKADGTPPGVGDLKGTTMLALRSDGANFRLLSLVAPSDTQIVITVSTVAANATSELVAGTASPAVASYMRGQIYLFRPAAANTTTAPQGAVVGLPPAAIVKRDGSRPAAGDLQPGVELPTWYDGTNFVVLCALPSDIAALGQIITVSTVAANATSELVAGTASPAVASYVRGQIYLFRPAAANTTTAPQGAVVGLSPAAIVKRDGSRPAAGDLQPGVELPTWFDGTNFVALCALPSDITAFGQVITVTTVPANSGSDLIAGTASPAVTAYKRGQIYLFLPIGSNTTTTPQAAVVGLPQSNLLKRDGTRPAVGDLQNGVVIPTWFDGTNFVALCSLPSDQAAAIATRPRGSVAFTAAGTVNWTVPAGVYAAYVKVVGGGGGGGVTTNASYTGGCGGGGGVAEDLVIGLVPGTALAIVVGAAGLGGNNSAGGNGGSSSFANRLAASGGGGGAGQGSANMQGGASGIGQGGSQNYGLGDGDPGNTWSTSSVPICSGKGGGPGGQTGTGSGGPGFPGRGPGGGGGGAAQGNNGSTGGQGYSGAVYIWWE